MPVHKGFYPFYTLRFFREYFEDLILIVLANTTQTKIQYILHILQKGS